MRKAAFFSLAIIWVTSATLWAQTPLKVDKKIPVTGNENFDILFTRSVMVGNVDTARFESSRSGAYSIGIGYGLPLGKALLLKFEPRVTWFKLYYAGGTDNKWFPTPDTSATLVYEKTRISYLEVPVSLKFKLARNYTDRYKLLLEAGFVFGKRLTSTFKTRHYTSVDATGNLLGPKITVKTNLVEDVSQIRFGPFVRLGTNWLSIYGFYRMSDIYRSYRKFDLPTGGSTKYPGFPRLEVGVTIAI
jgi:hypothetical protein